MKRLLRTLSYVATVLLLANAWLIYVASTVLLFDSTPPLHVCVLTWVSAILVLPSSYFTVIIVRHCGLEGHISVGLTNWLISVLVYILVIYLLSRKTANFASLHAALALTTGFASIGLWIIWPAHYPIHDSRTAIEAAIAQAKRFLLRPNPIEAGAIYLELRSPSDPGADLIDEESKERLRVTRGNYEARRADTYFYRSVDDVIDCPERLWIVAPKINRLTDGGTRYVLRQSDGRIIAAFYHRGE